MNELASILRDIIKTEGPVSLERYMQLALQHPDYGYYVKGDPLGHDGDFVTAPEISQMFGEMVGIWCAEMWRQMGKPAPFVLLEMGPGRGTLMQDALRATAKIEGFHQALRLCLMESDETLLEIQLEKLEAFSPRFIDGLGLLPSLPLIAIANEFFDALPIRQFVETDEGPRERLVDWGGERFVFVPENATGKVIEESPQAVALMLDLAGAIAQRGGAALVVDYGYAVASGESTLQAVSGHKFADPLDRPGEIDLTAHVDFSALRAAAEKAGARTSEIVTQGEFLCAMGIELRAAQLKLNATEEQAKDIDSALFRLTDPTQMGALFKTIAVTRGDVEEIPGFP